MKGIFTILKNMFSSKTEITSVTENWTGNEYVPKASDIRIIAGNATLIITDDKRIGGLWVGVDGYHPCAGTEQECFREMRDMIRENFEEAYDALIFKLGSNLYLLNIADCQSRSSYDEDGFLYFHLCMDMIDVFYPIIKRFIEKHSGGRFFGVTICFGGDNGTSFGLCRLIENLKQDGFGYCVIGTVLPFSKKKRNVWLENRIAQMGNYETFDSSPYIDKSKSIKEFFNKSIDILFDAMKQEVRAKLAIYKKEVEGEHLKVEGEHLKVDAIKTPMSLRLLQYGQCRTFADIIKSLNERNKYSSFDEMIKDLGKVIENFRMRNGRDDIALYLIENTIIENHTELFNDGIFDISKFLAFLEKKFSEGEQTGIDAIYTKRIIAKLLKLVKTLNDVCQYENADDLQTDIKSIYHQNFSNGYHPMSDPYPTIGNYPINWFISGLKCLWEQVTVDGKLDNDMMEKRMFTDHEDKVISKGIEAVIQEDFEGQGPCHPEVYYPKHFGTAPVYVEDETSRTYLTACGEGKGPRSGHDLYEMELIKPILEREVRKNKYEYINETFIPKDIHKPIFKKYYGRLRFDNIEDKESFITNVRK